MYGNIFHFSLLKPVPLEKVDTSIGRALVEQKRAREEQEWARVEEQMARVREKRWVREREVYHVS